MLTRIRSDERTRTYVERRAKQGLNKKDIMRCLKRFVVRKVYRALTGTLTERITQTDREMGLVKLIGPQNSCTTTQYSDSSTEAAHRWRPSTETVMNSGEPVAAQIRDGRFLPTGSFTRTQPTWLPPGMGGRMRNSPFSP